MSVSDFILGKRHLLGFVIPGAILVLAVVVVYGPESPYERFKAISTAEWIAVVAVGVLVGHAFGHSTFRLVAWLSQVMHRGVPLALRDEKDWMADKPELVNRVRQMVSEVVVKQDNVKDWGEEKLFDFCKLALLEMTKVWATKLDERETEINLLAMNVVPSAALLATWATKTAILEGSWSGANVILPVMGLLLPLLLLRSIQPLRCREREVVFEMFLELPMLSRIGAQKSSAATV